MIEASGPRFAFKASSTIAIICFLVLAYPILAHSLIKWTSSRSSVSVKYRSGPLVAPGKVLPLILSPIVDLGTPNSISALCMCIPHLSQPHKQV